MVSSSSLIKTVSNDRSVTKISRNNFKLTVTEDPTKRVLLSAVPLSGNWLLGPSDIDELLFMLQDSPMNEEEDRSNVSQASLARYRPSRVRAMFASRACRKAVMVGDPLTSVQMTNLLRQMSNLQQPWVIFFCILRKERGINVNCFY
jgi:DNA mismatch repair protein PMS2